MHTNTTIRLHISQAIVEFTRYSEIVGELESRMLEVVGSEPSFNLSKRCGLADAGEDMFDPLVLAVPVEAGFSSAYAPELRSVIGEDLSWLRVFTDRLIAFSAVPSLNIWLPVT
jgi:hypothetical protein